MRKTISLVCLGLGFALALYGLGFSQGRGSERAAHAAALAAAEREHAEYRDAADRSMAELRSSLDQSQARADGVVRGLADSVRLAASITDRSRRVAVLVDAIEGAVRSLRGGPDD